jgi:hypothetical protein
MSSSPSYARRDFLKTSLLAAALPALRRPAFGGPTQGLGAIRREVFVAPPHPGIAVEAASYYTRPTGLDLLSIHQLFARSDTVETAFFRYSSDNGRTWSEAAGTPMGETLPHGKRRRVPRACVVDPTTGRLIHFWTEAVLPNDDPLEGLREWLACYSVSDDGGQTWYLSEEIIVEGGEYTPAHPMAGVWRERSAVMIGDISSQPIFLADGTLLLPVEITPVGSDGRYFNPGGGYTYTNVALLRGRWDGARRRLLWNLSDIVTIDPAISTRGLDEPTMAVLADGRILLIMRGSNDKRPDVAGRRWVSLSSDAGQTWTKPRPWTYNSGEDFFSPSSASQALRHSSGRLFWTGNISPGNPTGNRPRYPIVIGEIDARTGLLIKASVRTVDDRAPAESALIQLSSPCLREDRETGEIVLNLTRWGEHSTPVDLKSGDFRALMARAYNWTASAYLYHIPV